MSVTTITRTVPAKAFHGRPMLSPGGEAARKALIEATKIVDESTVGKFLLKLDSPEGFAALVASTQAGILLFDFDEE